MSKKVCPHVLRYIFFTTQYSCPTCPDSRLWMLKDMSHVSLLECMESGCTLKLKTKLLISNLSKTYTSIGNQIVLHFFQKEPVTPNALKNDGIYVYLMEKY